MTSAAAPNRPAPAFDPELAERLRAAPLLLAPVRPDDVPALRKGVARFRPDDAALARGGVVQVRELQAPGPDGAVVPVLSLRPASAASAVPGVVFLHGGGMVSGDARTGIEAVLDWVVKLGVAVLSVGYRLAPEHPHPAAVEDALAALAWADGAREALGLDGAPLMLAGASAGGGLAAATALRARDGAGPSLGALMLMAPMLDDRARFPSSTGYAGDAPWDAQSNRTGWTALLGERAGSPEAPDDVAPARARDLAGLPPTFLDVGAVETFRDEGIDFGARLARAGVPVELHVWAGAFHGFDLIAPESAVARVARTTRLDWLRRRLRELRR